MTSAIVEMSAAMPIKELANCVSEETLEWLEDEDTKQKSWLKIQQVMANLKQTEDQVKNATVDEEKPTYRIKYWTSSLDNPDGFGGIEGFEEENPPTDFSSSEEEEEEDEIAYRPVKVAYILSDKWQGFGNQVWPSSRHLANMLVDKDKCQQLLEPLLAQRSIETPFQQHSHPLEGLTVCELGAGAGIPGWAAMYCGAKVVALDQAIPARIRCTAESAQRNYLRAKKSTKKQLFQPKVQGYDWGTPVDDVLKVLNDSQDDAENLPKFDVVIAADCCFMPWFYDELIDSISMLLSDKGVCILTFALHGNVPDEQNWSILDTAAEKGLFAEEIMTPTQLTPQSKDIHARSALCYTVRIVKKQNN